MKKNQRDKFSWLEAELNETYDEMFEAEFSEPMLPDEFWTIYKGERPSFLSLCSRMSFGKYIKVNVQIH